MDEKITVGWVVDDLQPNSRGRQVSIRNFREAVPDNIEIIDIDPNNPQECSIYAVHAVRVPKNLPLIPKKVSAGKSRLHPVAIYSYQWDIDAFGASIAIYQSPLHAKTHRFGKKHIIVPPVVEKDYTPGEGEYKRENKAMWCGVFDPVDGVDIAVRWSETGRIHTDYYGFNFAINIPTSNYCKFVGTISNIDMVKAYKTHEKFIFTGRSPQPFNRSFAEAYLAGCEVILSGDLGINSFTEDTTDTIEKCKASAKEYWDLIQGLV